MIKAEDFSKWFRKRLAMSGLSAKELSVKSGVDEATMSRLVNGTRMPTLRVIHLTSPYLNIPVEEMMIAAGIAVPVKKVESGIHVKIVGKLVNNKITTNGDGEDTLIDEMRGAKGIEVHGVGSYYPDGAVIIYNPNMNPKFGDLVYVQLKKGEPQLMKYMSLHYQIKNGAIEKILDEAHPIVLLSLSEPHAEPIVVTQDQIDFMSKIVGVHLP
jgi:transcriptional regulator with XRE-family HTH domain